MRVEHGVAAGAIQTAQRAQVPIEGIRQLAANEAVHGQCIDAATGIVAGCRVTKDGKRA